MVWDQAQIIPIKSFVIGSLIGLSGLFSLSTFYAYLDFWRISMKPFEHVMQFNHISMNFQKVCLDWPPIPSLLTGPKFNHQLELNASLKLGGCKASKIMTGRSKYLLSILFYSLQSRVVQQPAHGSVPLRQGQRIRVENDVIDKAG